MRRRARVLSAIGFWSILICLAAGWVAAGPMGPLGEGDIRAIVSQAPDEDGVPDADALVLFDGTYISALDGKVSVRRQRLIKIYTEHAVDLLGDPRIAYDRSRQELEIHASRTYIPDGSSMDTPENGYNEVTPFGIALSPHYLDIREMVVSHVGIVLGASILLDWTVRDTSPAGMPFSRLIMVQDEFPALEREVVADGDLYGEGIAPAGSALAPPDRQGKSLVWQLRDLSARPRYAAGRIGDQVAWIALSGSPTWEDLLGTLGLSVGAASSPGRRIEQILDEMEEEEPTLDTRECLERIVEAIGERTQLIRYSPWLFAALPGSAEAAIRRSSATPVERCALMLAACKARHLDAELIFPARWGSLTERVPALEALADPLVRVVDADATWYVDPVDGTVTPWEPVEGGLPYFVAGDGRADDGEVKVERGRVPAGANEIRLSTYWDLESGEAKADGSISGPVVAGLDWEAPGELIKQWAETWSDSTEAGDVRLLAAGPRRIEYAMGLKARLASEDDRGRVTVDLPLPPFDPEDLLPPNLALSHSRTDGVLFPPAPASVSCIWKVRLPEDYRLLPNREREVELDGGMFAVERKLTGDLVELAYRFEWDGRPVTPEVYSAYRGLMLDAFDRRLTRLVLAVEAESEE